MVMRAGVSAFVLPGTIHGWSAATVNAVEPPPSVWSVMVWARGMRPGRTLNVSASRESLKEAAPGAAS